MQALRRDRIFVGLTRPQMFGGVTYNYFVLNAIIAAELFLIFRSAWVLLVALFIHLAGILICLREPRMIELVMTKTSRCPRVKNYKLWQCNSYRP